MSLTKVTYAMINGSPSSVLDFGAVGDGVADDTVAIQAALDSSSAVFFPAGQTFKTTATLVVPTTCQAIYGTGATIQGPGSGGAADGFQFVNWYNTGGSVDETVKGARFYLPNIIDYKDAISLRTSSWVYIDCDLIKNCSTGIYVYPDSGKYCVECDIKIGMILKCTYGISENIPANTGGPVEGIQGFRYNIHYMIGCDYGIYRSIATSSVNTFNEYYIVELDGAGANLANPYAIYNSTDPGSNFIANRYRIPVGPINTTATPSPFYKCEYKSVYDMLFFQGIDTTPYNFGGFLAVGPTTNVEPAAGVMTVYVATTGSDVTGNGSSSAPYASVQKAINMIQRLNMTGNSAVISLAAGTYSADCSYNTVNDYAAGGAIYIRGVVGTPSSVTITGKINAQGNRATMYVEELTISTTGMYAQDGATLFYKNVVFGNTGSNPHITAVNCSKVQPTGNYTISGNASNHLYAIANSNIYISNTTITLTGTPAFSGSFAQTSTSSFIEAIGNTFSGGATGVYYRVSLNAVINTGGGGATYFPGNSAGISVTGGQYV